MLRASSAAFIQPISFVFITVIFVLSYRTPGFNLAALIATIYLIHKIFVDVESIQRSLHTISDLLPHTADIIYLMDSLRKYREHDLGDEPFSFQNELEFRDLFFSYHSGPPVLSGIQITVHKGDTIAVVGPSGVGKTSLVDLLLRLFTPEKGEIMIDGKDISSIGVREWRMHLGYVPQDIFLLNDTIRNNILFYRTGIGETDIENAVKEAHIYEYVQSLPDGLDTMVGDRGIMLSAGQRQRIVLARELAHHPEILVLDEATSALDNESESLIQKALQQLHGKVTVIMIAHRLSTVLDADRVYVLHGGRIIEEGNPRKLLEDPQSNFYKAYHVKRSALSV